MKKVFLILMFTQWHLFADAQSPWLLTQNGIQKTLLLPAHVPTQKFHLRLGEIYTEGVSKYTYGSIVQNKDGVNEVDLNAFATESDGSFQGQVDVNTFALGYSTGTSFLYAGHSLHYGAGLSFNQSILNLIAKGNLPYLGETLPLKINMNTNVYQKFHLGYAQKINALTVGAKLNYYIGWYNTYTENGSIDFLTKKENYAWQMTPNFNLHSSSMIAYTESPRSLDIDTDILSYNSFFTDNNGWGLDLGLEYDLTESLKINASILNVGKITWRDRTQNLSSKESFAIQGVDLAEYILDKNYDIADSLLNESKIIYNNGEYSSPIGMLMHIGGVYNYNESWMFGVAMGRRNLQNLGYFNFDFMTKYKISKSLAVGMSYHARNHNYTNVGLNISLDFEPVHFYINTQNVFGLTDWQTAKLFGASAGLAFTFGKIKARIED
jgi:hypothetical protein